MTLAFPLVSTLWVTTDYGRDPALVFDGNNLRCYRPSGFDPA